MFTIDYVRFCMSLLRGTYLSGCPAVFATGSSFLFLSFLRRRREEKEEQEKEEENRNKENMKQIKRTSFNGNIGSFKLQILSSSPSILGICLFQSMSSDYS